MTSTARRRWSRELESEVDGIAIGTTGPILLHGYDPPAGGKWIDDVIPGKLGALDRNSGELLWLAPCEVGYGRGFGAGIGSDGQALVLGPSAHGHRIVRMSLTDGELLDAGDIPAFDAAEVGPDICLCSTAKRVFAVDPRAMVEAWEFSREGERYHTTARSGDRAYVVYTKLATGMQGVLILDAETGTFEGTLIEPNQPVVHELCVTSDIVVVLTSDLARLLHGDEIHDLDTELAAFGTESTLAGGRDTLSLLALRADGASGDAPLWFRVLETSPVGEIPDVSILGDSGKIYLERGAYLEAVDALSGRRLGEWTVPGLDDRIAWYVVDGAGLLAEETRVSVFELPA